MTDKEFEAWMDEVAPQSAFYKGLKDPEWVKGARAAWAKAQDEIEKIQFLYQTSVSSNQKLRDDLKQQADNLAEALEFYANCEHIECELNWKGEFSWDSIKSVEDGEAAKQALKDYRGEK